MQKDIIKKQEVEDQKKVNSSHLKGIGHLALILFIGLSFYLFISAIILIFLTKSKKEIVVPHVISKQFISVCNSLIRKGLTPEIEFFDVFDIDNGIILKQHPEGGSIVSEGSKFNLIVSRSSSYVSVPNLIGLKLPLAINKLKNIHANNRSFTLGIGVISYIPSNKFADSMVIDHSPGPQEEVPPERRINLLVSAGKIDLDMRMPLVVGQSIDLCFDLLLSKGLSVVEEIVWTDRRNRSGIILSQKPNRGEEIIRGARVKLKVYYYPIKEHYYTSYERIVYTIPVDEKSGLYEAYVEDSKPKRIRFSRIMKPGKKIDFIFKRRGNAKITITNKRKVVEVIRIDVEEFK